MSLLNGQLSAVFTRAFAGIYLPATLHSRAVADDGEGSLTAVWTDYPCRAQIDSMTEAMRAQAGYADTDKRILVLAGTLSIKPDTDCAITVKGERFNVASINSDPAESYWEIRGSRG